jgi:hypothetical protein
VRNDGTPNRKKFLSILGYNQMVKNPETQEEYAKACNDEFYALFRERYSKYIGIINPVKLTLPYEKYIYCDRIQKYIYKGRVYQCVVIIVELDGVRF